MTASYYNTTHEAGADLREYQQVASNQEEVIMQLFRRVRRPMSPSDVLAAAFDAARPVPITSVRRAMTNLSNSGKLQKTDETRRGPFGRREHLWRLPVENPVQAELFA